MIVIILLSLVRLSISTIQDCDSSSLFRPIILELVPDPPIRNQPLFLNLVFYNPGENINDGTAKINIDINGLPYSETQSLCETTQCPILNGYNNRSSITDWPDLTGKVVSRITWTDIYEKSLLCIELHIKITENKFIQIYKKLENSFTTYYKLPRHTTHRFLRGNNI